MINNILLHLKDGNRILTRDELIEEAKRQEAEGITPHYVFYGKDTSDHITPPGWLVFSTWEDGAGDYTHIRDHSNPQKPEKGHERPPQERRKDAQQWI